MVVRRLFRRRRNGGEPLGEGAPPLVVQSAVSGAMPAEAVEPAAPLRRRLRGLLGWAVYLAVIAVAVFLGPRAMGWALDSQYPMATVSGDSMWPALNNGDIVIVKGVSGLDELEVGDIIALRHRDGMAIHRIVRIEGGTITTRGDANFREDPSIGIDGVIGKVPTIGGRLVKVPYLGYVASLLGPLTKQTNDVAGSSEEGPATEDAGLGTAYSPGEP